MACTASADVRLPTVFGNRTGVPHSVPSQWSAHAVVSFSETARISATQMSFPAVLEIAVPANPASGLRFGVCYRRLPMTSVHKARRLRKGHLMSKSRIVMEIIDVPVSSMVGAGFAYIGALIAGGGALIAGGIGGAGGVTLAVFIGVGVLIGLVIVSMVWVAVWKAVCGEVDITAAMRVCGLVLIVGEIVGGAITFGAFGFGFVGAVIVGAVISAVGNALFKVVTA